MGREGGSLKDIFDSREWIIMLVVIPSFSGGKPLLNPVEKRMNEVKYFRIAKLFGFANCYSKISCFRKALPLEYQEL